MMASTPTLSKKQDGIIWSSPPRQDCSHQTTAIANNHLLLLANESGISALICTTVNVGDSLLLFVYFSADIKQANLKQKTQQS